jgi:hypothetical protein
MKRFSLVTFAGLALLVPTLAGASQSGFVYRPELRQLVPVPQETGTPARPVSLREEIARHEHMAAGYRGTRMAQAAVHCERLIRHLREAQKVN